jgi:hypothetical protein
VGTKESAMAAGRGVVTVSVVSDAVAVVVSVVTEWVRLVIAYSDHLTMTGSRFRCNRHPVTVWEGGGTIDAAMTISAIGVSVINDCVRDGRSGNPNQGKVAIVCVPPSNSRGCIHRSLAPCF